MPKDITDKKAAEHLDPVTAFNRNDKMELKKANFQASGLKNRYTKGPESGDKFQVGTSKILVGQPSRGQNLFRHNEDKISKPAQSISEKSAKSWRDLVPQVELSMRDGSVIMKDSEAEQYYKGYLSESLWQKDNPGDLVRTMDLNVSMVVPGTNRVIQMGSYTELNKKLCTEVFIHKVLQLPQSDRTIGEQSGLHAIAAVSLMLFDGVLGLKEPVIAGQLDRAIPKNRRLEAYSMAMKTFVWAKDLKLFEQCLKKGASVTYHSIYDDMSLLEYVCMKEDITFLKAALEVKSSTELESTIKDILQSHKVYSKVIRELLHSKLENRR